MHAPTSRPRSARPACWSTARSRSTPRPASPAGATRSPPAHGTCLKVCDVNLRRNVAIHDRRAARRQRSDRGGRHHQGQRRRAGAARRMVRMARSDRRAARGQAASSPSRTARTARRFTARTRSSRSRACSPPGGDNVGCGDAFVAILVHGMTLGWDLEMSGDAASRWAAAVAGVRGATPMFTEERDRRAARRAPVPTERRAATTKPAVRSDDQRWRTTAAPHRRATRVEHDRVTHSLPPRAGSSTPNAVVAPRATAADCHGCEARQGGQALRRRVGIDAAAWFSARRTAGARCDHDRHLRDPRAHLHAARPRAMICRSTSPSRRASPTACATSTSTSGIRARTPVTRPRTTTRSSRSSRRRCPRRSSVITCSGFSSASCCRSCSRRSARTAACDCSARRRGRPRSPRSASRS